MADLFFKILIVFGVMSTFVFIIGLIISHSVKLVIAFILNVLKGEFKTAVGWLDIVGILVAFYAVESIPALQYATRFFHEATGQGVSDGVDAMGSDYVGAILICSVIIFSLLVTAISEVAAGRGEN